MKTFARRLVNVIDYFTNYNSFFGTWRCFRIRGKSARNIEFWTLSFEFILARKEQWLEYFEVGTVESVSGFYHIFTSCPRRGSLQTGCVSVSVRVCVCPCVCVCSASNEKWKLDGSKTSTGHFFQAVSGRQKSCRFWHLEIFCKPTKQTPTSKMHSQNIPTN